MFKFIAIAAASLFAITTADAGDIRYHALHGNTTALEAHGVCTHRCGSRHKRKHHSHGNVVVIERNNNGAAWFAVGAILLGTAIVLDAQQKKAEPQIDSDGCRKIDGQLMCPAK